MKRYLTFVVIALFAHVVSAQYVPSMTLGKKEKVPEKIDFMTSSCCPAFVEHVKKHFPEFRKNISETASPMVSCGQWVKDKDPEAMTCFIGPCIAKKAEAVHHPECMDFAMTYEELACIFDHTGEVATPTCSRHLPSQYSRHL